MEPLNQRKLESVLKEIERLEEEYETQKKNSPLQRNPFIVGLGAKIDGMKLALEMLLKED